MEIRISKKLAWKIVSGGQTGVDRAGLVAAMSQGIPFGGWVPKGRIAEDGVVPPEFYAMREWPKSGYRARTRANVVDSDATLILADVLPISTGTALTAKFAVEVGRPFKIVRLGDADAVSQIRNWMHSLENSILQENYGQIVLNVAGPRESRSPGIFERAKRVLTEVFADFRESEDDGIYARLAADDNEFGRMAAESAETPESYNASGD
ncbi:MAG: putative molybdenum carrier protein [Kiritimatiellae bacterium]|nr:putative molybdenum carrier protein [Kiritimatiellia bacterium]